MEKYFWTLTQTDVADIIKTTAHYCKMQTATDAQSSGLRHSSLSYIFLPLIISLSNSEYCSTSYVYLVYLLWITGKMLPVL